MSSTEKVNEPTTAAIEKWYKTPQTQRPLVDKGTVGAIRDKTNMIQSSEAASGGYVTKNTQSPIIFGTPPIQKKAMIKEDEEGVKKSTRGAEKTGARLGGQRDSIFGDR
ncbi:hypothetical protein NPIL_654411 [Nephila pilipes]|uniref:Uncharacterized protein n=1 Tax=Nephila pilipes TaxID=299642 RepID=A0A8X6PTM2_NEPPI|nr:hypothetical protein NPIL_654411 [Nephila pilipes]